MSYKRYKRQSILEQLFELLIELTGYFWQIGAIVTVVLLSFSYIALDWADNVISAVGQSPVFVGIIANLGWPAYCLPYSIPLLLMALAILFAWKTLDTFSNGRF